MCLFVGFFGWLILVFIALSKGEKKWESGVKVTCVTCWVREQ